MKETKKIRAALTWTDSEIISDIIKKIPNYGDPKCDYTDEIEVTIGLKRIRKRGNIGCAKCSYCNLSKFAKPCITCQNHSNYIDRKN